MLKSNLPADEINKKLKYFFKFSSYAPLLCVYSFIFANWEMKTNGVSFTFVCIWFQFYPQVLLSSFSCNTIGISDPAGKL